MKFIIYLVPLAVILFGNKGNAQKRYFKSFPAGNISMLRINIPLADTIIIDTWEKDSFAIEGYINVNQNTENDSLIIDLKNTSEELVFNTDLQIQKYEASVNLSSPRIVTDIRWVIKMPSKNKQVHVSSHTAYIWLRRNPSKTFIKSTTGHVFIDNTYERNVTMSVMSFHGRIQTKRFPISKKSTSYTFQLGNGRDQLSIHTVGGDINF